MPHVLHDPPTLGIVLFGVCDPVAEPDVIFDWPLQNLLSRDSELGTASRCRPPLNIYGFFMTAPGVPWLRSKARRRTCLVEHLFPDLCADVCILVVPPAPRVPVAPQVDIAVVSDEG